MDQTAGYAHFWLDPKFWVAMSFVIFVALAAKPGWAAITKMLDGRAEKISNDLAQAGRLREEAEAMLRQAQADRAAALVEAEAMILRSRAEVERVAAAAAAEAELAAQRRERMAMDRIAAAENAALVEVRNAAAEVAIAAARAVLAETIDAKADAALIDRAVADLPRALKAA